MASNAAISRDGPLTFMTSLSPNILLYKPTDTPLYSPSLSPSTAGSSATDRPPPPPRLVFFCGWMDAREVHLAKYVAGHQALWPSAQILLVKCPMAHMLVPSRAIRDLETMVVPALRAAFDSTGDGPDVDADGRPELLVHVFSNGGSAILSHLYRAYGGPLPRHVTVFDSAPGEFTYRGSWAAFTAGLSPLWRLALAPLVHAAIACLWALRAVFGRDPLGRAAAAHNNPRRNRGEARRAYVYSREDRLVGWEAVERHADGADERGFVVRRERFEGSEHVAHARRDWERYWRVVWEVWDGRGAE